MCKEHSQFIVPSASMYPKYFDNIFTGSNPIYNVHLLFIAIYFVSHFFYNIFIREMIHFCLDPHAIPNRIS